MKTGDGRIPNRLMTKAKSRTRTTAQANQLAWYQSLQFKLALIFSGLMLILGTTAYLSSKFLVGDKLVAETFRYELESGKRLVSEFHDIAQRVQNLAGTLSTLSANTPGGPYSVSPSIPKLVDSQGGSRLITAVGIWPLPHTLDPARERASLYWVRDPGGVLQVRGDYNDPRTIAYTQEKWNTPARYGQEDRCYWTPVYREPLTKRDVITCAMPMRNASGYVGAVTVSISLEALQTEFANTTQDDLGYSLLVDHDSRLLAISGKAEATLVKGERPRNLAELAQRFASFGPVALSLHKQDEERISAVARSVLFNAAEISALKDATRDFSRADAEAALTLIWASLGNLATPIEPQTLAIENDAVLEDAAFATLFQLPDTYWRLVRVTPATEGFSGARYILNQSLIVSGGGMALTLLLVFSGLRYLVIRPLRRMAHSLASAETAEDAMGLVLDESARNEVGMLAHWHNERTREFRELMERTIATNAQLVMESDERRSAQEQLARIQERASLALQSVADGVITTNEKGDIEDMNPVAENLTGVALRAARGKAFGEVFIARIGGESGSPAPNLAQVAIQRGSRLEYADGVLLTSFGGAQRSIGLTATPIRTRHNRVIGAVIVFRESSTAAAAVAAGLDRRGVDAVTGLRTRNQCERKLRALIEAARLSPRRHSFITLDLDHLKRINDSGGQAAGDEVLSKIGETLSSKTGSAGEVFRMTADQFAVILENSDAARARTFAEALREAIANTRLYWESKFFTVTASFGLGDFDGSGDDNPVDIIRRADDACAAAKRAGRNAVKVYDSSMSRGSREVDDATWVRRIRAGLDQNLFHLTTQFILPSPPQVAEGNVFEILLALEDEEGFWASPGAFMQAAERNHLTAEMDRWVIARTLAQLARNSEVLERLAFAGINLSTSSLNDSGLLEFLAITLEKMPVLHPRKLCFELHEDAVMEYPQQAQTLADALRSIGCRVTLDHFLGRDPSVLTLLKNLPVDFVKVDAQRFKNIASDPMEVMLADSVVRIARGLRKRVIVGNIDGNSELEAWRKLGVDYVQGFTVAKPSPVVFKLPHT